MKKLLTVLLVVVILTTQVFAAGAKESEDSSGSAKLTYWSQLNPVITANDFSELPYWQELMARTNTDITFEHVSSDGNAVKEAFSILIASGDYPDIIEYTWREENPQKMIEDGVILPLNDIFEKYCPNITKLLNDYPEIKKMISTDDGTYYCFPCLRSTTYVNNNLFFTEGWVYRMDLLEKVGVTEVPETADELYDLLVKLKKADLVEWPICIRGDHINRVFGPAFDTWGDNNGFYQEDGVVKNSYLEPQRYDFLQYVHKLYAEGLLDKDYLSVNKKTLGTKILNSKTAIGYAPGGSGIGTWLPQMQKEDPNVRLVSGKPLTSKKGTLSKFAKMDSIYSGSGAAITSACKNIEAAARLLDYQYGEAGHLLANFGIEGVSYTMVDGYPTYTDLVVNNPEGKSMSEVAWQYMRATVNGPFVQDPRYLEQYYSIPELAEAINLWAQTDYGKYVMPTTAVPNENLDEYTKIMNNLNTLTSEMEARFITGDLELTEETFADYQNKIKALGLEKAIAWRQEGLDSYNAK